MQCLRLEQAAAAVAVVVVLAVNSRSPAALDIHQHDLLL